MKDYLLEMFAFNQKANETMIDKIAGMENPEVAIRMLSHVINSQNKWLRRIQVYPAAPDLDWWDPQYPLEQLKEKLQHSTEDWMVFLEGLDESAINKQWKFIGYDSAAWEASLRDIALQLIYHSFHHRAQIQVMIRDQGGQPDFIDFIGTKYTRLAD